jgi:hypothetical protein
MKNIYILFKNKFNLYHVWEFYKRECNDRIESSFQFLKMSNFDSFRK